MRKVSGKEFEALFLEALEQHKLTGNYAAMHDILSDVTDGVIDHCIKMFPDRAEDIKAYHYPVYKLLQDKVQGYKPVEGKAVAFNYLTTIALGQIRSYMRAVDMMHEIFGKKK